MLYIFYTPEETAFIFIIGLIMDYIDYTLCTNKEKNMKGLTLTIKVWCCPRSIHTKCHGLMGTSGETART